MKKSILTIAFITLTFCTSIAQTNDLMPKTLRIESAVLFDNKENTYPEKREFQRKDFFQVIMENVLKENVKPHDPYRHGDMYNIKTKEFTIKDIEEKFDAVDETIMVEDLSKTDGTMIETTIEGEYDIKEVKGIVFLDEWYFDTEKFTFNKKVVAYTPVRSYFRDIVYDETDEIVRKKVCTLNFENLTKKQIKKSNKRLLHYATVQYEQKTHNYNAYFVNNNCNEYGPHENENAPFLTSYGRNMLAETIFYQVLKAGKDAYSFHSQKRISVKEIEERMGASTETVLVTDVENPNGPMKEVTIEGEYYLSDIQSYIFTEDWHLDPVTLRIVKKVRAIAPVRYYIRDYGEKEEVNKVIVFEVKFD